MTSLGLKAFAAVLIGTGSMIATHCLAQDVTAPPQAALAPADAAPLAVQQMDQLVAPVALYDDPLLVEVLTASSHPVDVVAAQGWISNPINAALKGDALATALANQTWDSSVKALVPFPQVLNLMYYHLDWTEQLGDAFVADKAAVMDSVQRMRHRAQSAGTLNSSPQQTVASDGDFVTIAPPASEIYVPVYDPWCVYGSWQVSAPFYYDSWPGYCTADNGMINFGTGFYRPFGYGEWGDFDWRHHGIHTHGNHFAQFHSGHVWGGFDRDSLGDHHFGGSGVANLRPGGDGLGAGHFADGGLGGGHMAGGGFGPGHGGGGRR
jgi:hypothetical protein